MVVQIQLAIYQCYLQVPFIFYRNVPPDLPKQSAVDPHFNNNILKKSYASHPRRRESKNEHITDLWHKYIILYLFFKVLRYYYDPPFYKSIYVSSQE